MAITTRDGLLAGLKPRTPFFKSGATMEAAGVQHSLIFTTGVPGAATVPSPGINGAAITGSVAGFIKPPAAVGGQNIYLARAGGTANNACGGFWYDYLWWNSGIVVTTTTAQAITPVAIPARDSNGTTDGVGVQAGILVSTATTNAGAIAGTTLNYTNSAGTAGRTATMTSFPATAVAGTFVLFNLQAGDTGVRSIQGITLTTSYVAGAIHLVLARLINEADYLANIPVVQDAFGTAFERIYDDSCLAMHYDPTATTATTFKGGLNFAQG